jgi:uncharacterized protein (TIGR02246 family)
MRSVMTGYEQGGANTDLQSIDEIRAAHVAALNSGDAQAWAALFTEDAVQMPPNAPENIGRPNIRSWSQAFLDQFRVHFALAVDEVHIASDWAFERGSYTISLTAKAGGPPLKDIGKYITIYQRDPELGWRMARDIWNSNNPPAVLPST